MRSRTLREGSVGLLILAGIGLFAILVLWLRGLALGRRSYTFRVQFDNVTGLQTGATVRYRGVSVGKITAISPSSNGVNVTVEITEPDLTIPRDVRVEANQFGFLGETAIDVIPQARVSNPNAIARPFDDDCNPDRIVCEDARLQGEVGISFEQLTRATLEFTETYSDPEFVAKVQSLVENTATATQNIAQLSKDISDLSVTVRDEFDTLSDTAQASTVQIAQAATQMGNAADRVARLTTTVDTLLATNRTTIAATLTNLERTSNQVRRAADNIAPILTKVDRTLGQLQRPELFQNLDRLSANAVILSENAAQASENLRQVSATISDPTNVVLLQETLDSARATFENAQKITSDLDDLTGDPAFRNNFKELVEGLSNLISSSQQLQQQMEVARRLEPIAQEADRLNAQLKSESDVPDKPPMLFWQMEHRNSQKSKNTF